MQHINDELLTWTYRPPGDETPFGLDVWVNTIPGPTPDAPERYQLRWGDRVANVWAENYDDPAVCFARLAVLLSGVRTGGFFRHQSTDDGVWDSDEGGDGPAEFVTAATQFLDDQLSVTS